MGAEDERDPQAEPDDESGGALQRAGAGGLEGGRGGRGGEKPPPQKKIKTHIYTYIYSLLLIYMVNICCNVFMIGYFLPLKGMLSQKKIPLKQYNDK